MSDLLTPWIKMQQQMLDAHKNNVDTMFRQMDSTGFGGSTKVIREAADAQIQAWEKWLALWGPRD